MLPRIIVSLDDMERFAALDMAKKLKDEVFGFKVNDLIIRYGASIINDLAPFGLVMADCKLFDIPNTMKNSVKHLIKEGATYITIHATCGIKSLEAAVKTAENKAKIVAVTSLTSMSISEVYNTYNSQNVGNRSNDWHKFFNLLLEKTDIYGIVCPAQQLKLEWCNRWKKFVPGIRIPTKNAPTLPEDDQKRITNCLPPGADYVIIGRPITRSLDPVEAIKAIKEYHEPDKKAGGKEPDHPAQVVGV